MKRIPLVNSDRVAIVDDCDFDLVSQYRWRLQVGQGNVDYALSATKVDGRYIQMHNLMVPHLPKFVVDHIDFDGLHNRRKNLRVTTQQHNSIHRRLGKNNKSGFRGVSLNEHGRWVASITHSGKFRFLGSFGTAEEAAIAFDKAALELRGQAAELNFPSGLVEFPVTNPRLEAA